MFLIGIFVVILIVALSFSMGGMTGSMATEKAIRKEAVEAGVGEYVIDGDKAKFQWKTPK